MKGWDEKLADAIVRASWKRGKPPQTVPVEVVGKDADGTVHVRFPGAASPTPVRYSGASAEVGDTVMATVRDGYVYVDGGNVTDSAPSGSELKRASAAVSALRSRLADEVAGLEEAIEEGDEEGAEALSQLERDMTALIETVEQAAEDAQATADATHQHFWHDSSGAHVDTSLGDENILINSLGILLRTSSAIDLSITRGAINFYDANSNVIASYGTNGIVIGSSSAAHIGITSSGIALYDQNSALVGTFAGSDITLGSTSGNNMLCTAPDSGYGRQVKFRYGAKEYSRITGYFDGQFNILEIKAISQNATYPASSIITQRSSTDYDHSAYTSILSTYGGTGSTRSEIQLLAAQNNGYISLSANDIRISASGTVSQSNIRKATIKLTPTTAGTTVYGNVTWSAMNATPVVVATAHTTVPERCRVGVMNESATGCTVYLNRDTATETTINIIAIA